MCNEYKHIENVHNDNRKGWGNYTSRFRINILKKARKHNNFKLNRSRLRNVDIVSLSAALVQKE